MLYLSLQGMETIIQKRDTQTKLLTKLGFGPLCKKHNPNYFLWSMRHFIKSFRSARTTHNCRHKVKQKYRTRLDFSIAMFSL